MRDYERIARILELIKDYWVFFPELRLCQIICNILGHHKDLFYIEDTELEQKLKERIAGITWEVKNEN